MSRPSWRHNPANRQAFLAQQKRANGKNVEYRRNLWLVKRYGITLEQYDAMFDAQGGVCALCFRPSTDGRRLHVDHNHLTGAVRGLLCLACNTKLATVEDHEWMSRAKEYLK